jgi:hypothetical protein
MFSVFDISIDPGVNTGYCVWCAGKIAEIPDRKNPGCLSGKGDSFMERIMSVRAQVSELFAYLNMEGVIGRVAVEEFMGYSSKLGDKGGQAAAFGKISMIKCATMRGVIISVALAYTHHVTLSNKRQIKKTETAQLARAYGVATKNKDALDAVQIGVCSGFDRNRGIK